MPGPWTTNDFEHACQLESAYDTEPDAPAGGDFFRCRTEFPFERVQEFLDRDQEKDNSASVHTTQPGRESSTWQIEGAVTPSGTAAPTAPDMTDLFEAHMGTKHVMTTNTSTTTGSSGTVINLATSGVSNSGIAVGDLIAMDVSTADGVEVRATAALPGSDTIHVSLAFSSASPASGRTIYGSATYYFTRTNEKTLQLYEWLGGNNFRQKVGGAVATEMEISCDFSGGAPEAMVKFSGAASRITTHTNSKPTPTLAGQPLVIGGADGAYAWVGSTKFCMVKFALKSNNGLELRNNESCSAYPTGTKRTGNDGRYSVTLDMTLILTTTGVSDFFDNADAGTLYPVHIQLGKTAGKILGIYAPRYMPKVKVGSVDGQPALELSGRLYGNGTDDTEFRFGFM